MYKRKSYTRKRTTTRRRRPMLRKKRTLRRRKTYTKRKITKTTKKYVGHEPTQQLMVYLNPFSTRTQQPKIPDGSRNYSLGVSLRGQNMADKTAPNTLYVALFPGAKSWTVYGQSVIGTPPTQWFSSGIGPINTTPEGDANEEPAPNEISAWRGVSFGMKLSAVSNTHQDAGFWRAIRIRGCDAANTGTFPSTAIEPAITNFAMWPNDPSFSSGTLRNLSKKDFILATENDEHLWTQVTLPGVSVDRNDHSFDIVLIQIVSDAAQSILINTYGNYELAYHERSPLNRFQTQSAQVLPSVLAKYQQMKRRKTVLAAT